MSVDARSGRWPVAPGDPGYGRFGTRNLTAGEIRRLGRVGALLYLVCGVSVVQIWATAGDAVAHPPQYLASGLAITAIAAALLVLVRVAADHTVDARYPALGVATMFGAAVLVPVVLYFAGFAAFAIGSTVYILPLIFGFWLLTRVMALALVATIAVGHAVLLSVSDHVVAPASQWGFLLAVLIAAGILVGGLADRVDRSARAELLAREALAEINRSLEQRVGEQVEELERLSRLRRFLSPQVADAVVSSGSDAFLAAHRREIAVFFCDLRGFTAFATSVEPEEVVDVLNQYYDVVGEQLHKFDATVGAFAGDGIMAYLNDPNPCDEPAWRAVQMAMGLRDPMAELERSWARQGYELSYGVGLALGHATLGVIGFEGRSDYTPLGTVVNLASRLCDEAGPAQVLVDRRVHVAVEDRVLTRELAPVPLKGFPSAVPVFEVLG